MWLRSLVTLVGRGLVLSCAEGGSGACRRTAAVAFHMALVRAFTAVDTCVIPLLAVVMSSTFGCILQVLEAKVD